MSSSTDWHERLLCIFFIGKHGPNGKVIPREQFNASITRLRIGLKEAVGGYTTVRSLEAKGDTRQWGPEPTRLIVVIVEDGREADLNVAVKCFGVRAADELGQQAIWVIKQRVSLFVAQRSSDTT